jgi:hypothetical protein
MLWAVQEPGEVRHRPKEPKGPEGVRGRKEEIGRVEKRTGLERWIEIWI